MELDIAALLRENTTLLFFLVVGIGYVIGKRKIGSIEIGSTTGVLLAGLFLGHFGFQDSPDLASLGFTLFIFSVGFQAGPRFFSVFLQDGAKYVALSVVVAVTGSLLAITLARIAGFDYGVAAGLLGGALTSTPTLAGAQDAVKSGLAALPDGVTAEQALQNVSVGYAITYLFGTIGLIVFIRYFPILLRIDLHREAVELANERGLKEEGESEYVAKLPILRAYRANLEEAIGRSLREIQRKDGYRGAVLRIRRAGGELVEPDGDTVVEKDDVVAIVADVEAHRDAQVLLGSEVLDEELLDYRIDAADIVISTQHAVGKPIAGLEIVTKFGCFASGIRRSGVELSFDPQIVLAKGDILTVTGEKSRLKTLVEELGFVERQVEETDLVVLSFAIVIGLVFGTLLVKLGQLQIGLGSAGGLLLAGILVGALRTSYPTFGRVPPAARFIFMELGLMFFMASVGLKAGKGIIEALTAVGPTLIVCGITVTLTPVIVGYFFGRHVLKLNPALLLGSITGSMTSTPSLNIVTKAANSSIPALGYAGTYTFANIFLTFAGTLLMTL